MQVRETEAMPPEDFERHMLLRHAQTGEIGTLTAIHGIHRGDRSTWEKYHKYLHDSEGYDHEH